jgi:hypothetical protein
VPEVGNEGWINVSLHWNGRHRCSKHCSRHEDSSELHLEWQVKYVRQKTKLKAEAERMTRIASSNAEVITFRTLRKARRRKAARREDGDP